MNTEEPVFVRRGIQQLQITVFALAMGTLVFVGVVIVMQALGALNINLKEFEFLAYAGVLAVALVIPIQAFICTQIDARNRKLLDRDSPLMQPWINAYGRRIVTGCALINAATFFSCIGSMLTGLPWGLIAAGMGAAAMIALHFPSASKFNAFVERQRDLMQVS